MASKEFTPSPQQQALFDEVKFGNSNILLVAVAGAGKSTSLVKAAELMRGSVFFGAYNSKIAKELGSKTAHLSNVKCSTFHGAGYGKLRYAMQNLRDPNDKKVLNLIEDFILEKGRNDLTPMAPTIAKTVSMAKQRGIGVCFPDRVDVWEDMIEHFDLLDDLPEEFEDRDERDILGIVIKLSSIILRRSIDQARDFGLIDFDDMIYMPLVMNLRMFKNDWVLIDEAQDTNPTRRELAKRMLKPGGRLIAVGDPRQAIYGFSGADNDAMDQIRRTFGCKEMPLTVTYRCPKSVVAVAQEFVSHIEAHESAPKGEYKVIEYSQVVEAAQLGDAILCRYNKYLVNLCFKFIRNGVPAKIEGRAIGKQLVDLMRKWKVKKVDVLAARVIKWQNREVTKAMAKKNETKVDQIKDRAETILVLIERAKEQQIDTVDGLVSMTESLFDDRVVDRKDIITLCSAHRSKGMEWERVFILGLYELMGRQCRQTWQTEQEQNLQYVAVTRSMGTLIDVVGVREERKQHNFDTEEA